MRKPILVVMTAVLVLALATVAMAGDPFVGTWKENVAKSRAASPNKSQVVVFTAQENGLKLAADGVNADGTTFHVSWTAKFDAKDYPITGFTNADTIAITSINANTFSELFKEAGKKVVSARLIVSKDGKTLTRTTNGKNAKGEDVSNTYVFDKQ